MQLITTVFLYTLLPVIATAAGGLVASFFTLSGSVRSGLQHFAAGVVFAVASVDLLPDIVREHTAFEVAVSFALGVGVMLGMRWITEKVERDEAKTGGTPWGLLTAVGIDVLIDGLLLGIGFAVGQSEGRLLALAMTLEGVSLGLATAAVLRNALGRSRAVATTAGLGLLFMVGGVLGVTVLQGLSRHAIALVLSFGLAALLFLVTEELLVEAHEVPETPLITALFFAGFLLFLVLGMLS